MMNTALNIYQIQGPQRNYSPAVYNQNQIYTSSSSIERPYSPYNITSSVQINSPSAQYHQNFNTNQLIYPNMK
jgi:hypothetical protein